MHHTQLRHGVRPHQASTAAAAGPSRISRNSNPQRRCIKVQARRDTTVEQDVQQEQQQQQEEATGFSAVVQRLLHRAASSLTRGTTTCLSCKGTGTCTCPACNGAGVTDRDTRQTMMRHTAQKLRSVLNVDRSQYTTDWLTSNRCRRCHGSGVMVCPACQGLGTRHAGAANKPPQ